jgi:hypothetical protein
MFGFFASFRTALRELRNPALKCERIGHDEMVMYRIGYVAPCKPEKYQADRVRQHRIICARCRVELRPWFELERSYLKNWPNSLIYYSGPIGPEEAGAIESAFNKATLPQWDEERPDFTATDIRRKLGHTLIGANHQSVRNIVAYEDGVRVKDKEAEGGYLVVREGVARHVPLRLAPDCCPLANCPDAVGCGLANRCKESGQVIDNGFGPEGGASAGPKTGD